MPRFSRIVSLVFALALGVSTLFLNPKPVGAWKVYTHIYIAQMVRDDLLDDGKVTINGQAYAVPPEVVQALRDYPEYYYGGVIGPDGFPEVVFGQSIIHPENTGAWIRHVYRSAWVAQDSPDYTSQEKAQILAFAYGYLTHPAGDMWAHTLVNDFAQGVFPSITTLANSVEARSIVLRHQVMEGYMRSATPGYDGNPDRGPAPHGYATDAFDPTVTTGQDVSHKSTPAFRFEAPHEFLYRTLVDPNADTPQDDRGVLIDGFLELRSFLEARVTEDPQESLATLVGIYNEKASIAGDALREFETTLERTGAVRASLGAFVGECDPLQNPALANPYSEQSQLCADATAALTQSLTDLGLASLFSATAAIGVLADGIEASLSDLDGLAEDGADAAQAAVDVAYYAVASAYFEGWVRHIDDGLRNWSRLGLGISQGMFDAQTFRDTQNAQCQYAGGEYSQNRINCENAVSKKDVVLHATSDFVETHLIPMLGEPEGVVGIRTVLGQLVAVVDTAIGVAGIPLNPIRETKAQVREAAQELINTGVQMAFGLDLEQVEAFATNASNWMAVEQDQVSLPGLGDHVVQFFDAGDHARVDAYMGLPSGHHVDGPRSRIHDDASIDPGAFAAFHNTRVMTALVLLGTNELNRLTGINAYFDGTTGGRTIPANVMVDGLDGSPWLLSIDSDHAWRANRNPRFAGNAHAAGTGQFPLWESCQTRDTFRELFKDWEPQRSSLAAVATKGATGRQATRQRVAKVFQSAGPVPFPDLGDPCTPTYFSSRGEAIVVTDVGLSVVDLYAGVKEEAAEPAPKKLGDLTIALTGPRILRPGQGIDRAFGIVVANEGQASVKDYAVHVYASDVPLRRGAFPNKGDRIGRVSSSTPLAANQSAPLQPVGRIPARGLGGRVFICAAVDPEEQISEAREDNNVSCIQARTVGPRNDSQSD